MSRREGTTIPWFGSAIGAALIVMTTTAGAGAQAPRADAAAAQARQRLAALSARLQTTGDPAVAAERLALLASMMPADPAGVLRGALSPAARAALPADAQRFVEQQTEVEGDVEIYYEDADSGATLKRYLRSGNRRVSLHFASEPGDMLTGDRVRVRGVQAGEALAADGGAAVIQPVTSALAYARGEQKALMILVNFQNAPVQPYSVDTASALLLSTVNNFDRENSQDQTWITGQVTGWHTIPLDNTVCDTTAIRTYARQAAARTIDLTQYKRFIYAFPSNSGCSWWGLGQVGGSTSDAWVNGNLATRVVAHELGHNYGVYHSRALECGTTTLGATCSSIEYGNVADIMGMSGTVAHFNAFQKERMGWLNYGASYPMLTVTGDGVFTVEPYAQMTAGPKALKILKSVDPATLKRTYYYVEYRRGVGFDASLTNNASLAGGVVIHTGSEASANSSEILDMTPETSSWTDPALPVGRAFYDATSGVTITTLSTGTTGATVDVRLGTLACVAAPPEIVSNRVAASGLAGSTVSYALTVRNMSGAACAPATFAVTATAPGGWTSAVSPATVTLAPGATGTVTLQVTSAAAATEGTYAVAATATDAAATLSAQTAMSYTVIGSLAATVSTDRASYTRGQSAVITTTVSAGAQPFAGATVALVVTRPNGTRINASATTNSAGQATYTLRLKTRDPLGTYTVRATATAGTLSAVTQTTFTVQ